MRVDRCVRRRSTPVGRCCQRTAVLAVYTHECVTNRRDRKRVETRDDRCLSSKYAHRGRCCQRAAVLAMAAHECVTDRRDGLHASEHVMTAAAVAVVARTSDEGGAAGRLPSGARTPAARGLAVVTGVAVRRRGTPAGVDAVSRQTVVLAVHTHASATNRTAVVRGPGHVVPAAVAAPKHPPRRGQC